MHVKPELQTAFAAGRLLILSPFERKYKRITAALAEERNRFVSALASRIFVAHAAPASKTMILVHDAAAGKKPILTVADTANRSLMNIGAVPLDRTDC